MKKQFIVSIIIGLLPCLLIIAKPVINVEPALIDAGMWNIGTPLTGSFTVANAGTVPLHIRIKTTCNCTIINNKEFALTGNQNATINFKVETANEQPGRITKAIIIESDAPEQANSYVLVRMELVAAGQAGNSSGTVEPESVLKSADKQVFFSKNRKFSTWQTDLMTVFWTSLRDGLGNASFLIILILLPFWLFLGSAEKILRAGTAFIVASLIACLLLYPAGSQLIKKAGIFPYILNIFMLLWGIFLFITAILNFINLIKLRSGDSATLILKSADKMTSPASGNRRFGLPGSGLMLLSVLLGLSAAFLNLSSSGVNYLLAIEQMFRTGNERLPGIIYFVFYNLTNCLILLVILLVACFAFKKAGKLESFDRHRKVIKLSGVILFFCLSMINVYLAACNFIASSLENSIKQIAF